MIPSLFGKFCVCFKCLFFVLVLLQPNSGYLKDEFFWLFLSPFHSSGLQLSPHQGASEEKQNQSDIDFVAANPLQ